jgi:hypothetical protein
MFPWILGTILLVYEWNVDRKIAGREQTTQGVITAHEPENHNRFGYVFTVNSKSFNGWESQRARDFPIEQNIFHLRTLANVMNKHVSPGLRASLVHHNSNVRDIPSQVTRSPGE